MNPAAVKANAKFMNPGGTIIYDSDSFNEKNLQKANFETDDPFTECNLKDFFKIPVPISSLTKESLKDFGLDNKSVFGVKICLHLVWFAGCLTGHWIILKNLSETNLQKTCSC